MKKSYKKQLDHYSTLAKGMKKPFSSTSKGVAIGAPLLAALPLVNIQAAVQIDNIGITVTESNMQGFTAMFTFTNVAFSLNVPPPNVDVIGFINTNNYFLHNGNSGRLLRLNSGASVGATTTNFANVASQFIYYSNTHASWTGTDQLGYAGFSIEVGGQTHYGWMELQVTTVGAKEVTVGRVGIEDMPNTPIQTPNFVLPVELSYLKAQPTAESIALHWRTETETNNAGFEVQRSENGKEFKTLEFIKGAGTAVEPQEYAFEDKTARNGVEYFYRLKQIDFDGAFEYSEMVTAALKSDKLEVSEVFPNPVSDQAQINVTLPQDEQLTISIFDLAGKPLRTFNQQLDAGVNTLTINVNDLPAGSYFVKLENATEKMYRKIIIK